MTPTIVCAIDTKTPADVVRTAGDLAAGLDAHLILTHVQGDPPLLPGSVADRDRARNRLNRAGLAVLRGASRALPEGIDAEYRSELGSVVGRLCRVAQDVDAFLVVTGCRRRGALVTSLLGSVSHDLARQAPCPVMIVPGRPATDEPSRAADLTIAGSTVVVGIDGSEESVAAAAVADGLARTLGDQLLLVHGYDAPGPIPTDIASAGGERASVPAVMQDALDHVTSRARYLVERGPAAHVLEDVAARENAGLIVIGSEDHARFVPLHTNSVAAQLPRHGPCPVLVVRGARHPILPEPARAGAQLAAA
jgi:nucleotide-binding universal stress UspA family protein